MSSIALTWLLSFVFFAGYSVFVIIAFIVLKPRNRFGWMWRSYLVFLPTVFLTVFMLADRSLPLETSLLWLQGIGLTVLMWAMYCIFYSVIDRSISVRLCVDLWNSEKNHATYAEIISRYDPDRAVARRLEILVSEGYLEKTTQDSELSLTPKGRDRAERALRLKRLFGFGLGG